uniref:(California timema) hypothetical protein n=1 Tax=Timema californicum TaxID=61474 RepID=A0A7R9IYP8_TIMCA|nr:unnamed protein product [Timema californicum]
MTMGPTYGTRCVPVQCRCAPKPHTDPKLYPARVGAPPEVESSRYDQPNAFLLKIARHSPDTIRESSKGMDGPVDEVVERLLVPKEGLPDSGRSHLTEASSKAACDRAVFLCELQAAYASSYPHGMRVN